MVYDEICSHLSAATTKEETLLIEKCKQNAYIHSHYEEDYSFRRIDNIFALKEYFDYDWAIKTGILYSNLAFVCAGPRDWWTLKHVGDEYVPFESCDMGTIAAEYTDKEFMVFISKLRDYDVSFRKTAIERPKGDNENAINTESVSKTTVEESDILYGYYQCPRCGRKECSKTVYKWIRCQNCFATVNLTKLIDEAEAKSL